MNFNFIIPRYNDEEKYRIFAEASLKRCGFSKVLQVLDKPGEKETIFQKYNAGIEALLQTAPGLADDDVCIFMHSDVGIVDPFFRQKMEIFFTEKRDVALMGIAGTIELTDKGGWWMNVPDKLRGHLLQGKPDGKIGEGFHLVKGPVGFYDDVVAIDGCFMATTGRYLKEGIKFDTETFNEGNDFYDIDFCLQFLEKGYKIAVADILLYHQSQGMGSLEEPWKINRDKLFKKWQDKGYKLPFLRQDFKTKENVNNIVEIEI